MSKLTKSEVARINGAKSRGPKTPEGRAISSMNALKHGISARTHVLQNESQEEFDQMMKGYFDYLQPTNQIENDLITDLVSTRWRLRRTWRYQTAMLDIEMDVQAPDFEKRFERFDEDMRGALAFTSLSGISRGLWTTLHFEIHLSRTFRLALDQFRQLRNS